MQGADTVTERFVGGSGDKELLEQKLGAGDPWAGYCEGPLGGDKGPGKGRESRTRRKMLSRMDRA